MFIEYIFNPFEFNLFTIDSFNPLSVPYKIILKTRFWNRFEIDSVPIILNLLGNRLEKDYTLNRPTIDSFNRLSVHYKIILKTRFWNRFEIDSVPIILNLLGNRFENDYALIRPSIDWGKQHCREARMNELGSSDKVIVRLDKPEKHPHNNNTNRTASISNHGQWKVSWIP